MKTRFALSKVLAMGVFAAALALATIEARAAKISAVLDPANISAGDTAQLAVTSRGNESTQYMSRATAPIAVEVTPDSGTLSRTAQTTRPPSQIVAANPPELDLAPNRIEKRSFASSVRPVAFAPWCIALQGLTMMALVIVFLIHRRRQRQARDPRRARERSVEAAIREELAAMDEALAANSAPAFFSAARHAVQERLAHLWKLPVSQVTVAEINRRVNGQGDDLRALFAIADSVIYSGQRVLPGDLERWKHIVIHHLRRLE